MIGTSIHRSPVGAGTTVAIAASKPLEGIPWKLNPPVFRGDTVHFCSFEKGVIIFVEYVGFENVLKDMRVIPVANPSIAYA